MASFTLCWFFPQRGGFLHSANAAVGMTMLVRFYGFAHCFHNVSRCTAFPSSVSPSGEPASPRGSSCTVLLGGIIQPHRFYSICGGRQVCRPYGYVGRWFRSSAWVVFAAFLERHTGRSLRFRWWVVPFNRTSCICNVPGGRLPPLQYICSVLPHF